MEKAPVVFAVCCLLYSIFIKPHKAASIMAMISIGALLSYRAFIYKHFPVIGLFETLNFFSFAILVISFFIKAKKPLEKTLTNIFALILLSFSLFAQSSASPFLPDSLKTILFPIHVAFSFISYAFFTLAFINVVAKSDTKTAMELNYFGFAVFTIGLWAGGIWAFKAWGAYFLFSIKEIFSFVIWIYYAGLIHVRFFKKKELFVYYGTIIGFIIVIFTYIGIGLFMKNTHSL